MNMKPKNEEVPLIVPIVLIIIVGVFSYFLFSNYKDDLFFTNANSTSVDLFNRGGTIKFEKTSYTCKAGETFETKIQIQGDLDPSKIASYTTSDSNIATIDDNTSIQTNCTDCRIVKVTCIKEGNVTLEAKTSTGAKTTSKLKVEKSDTGTIAYGKKDYSCKAGESFETMISVKGGTVVGSVKSYSSSDNTIAEIDTNTSSQVKCIDCLVVRVVCKKAGSVKLNAESTTGAKTTSNLSVKSEVGTIAFDKESYTCKPGESFETMIRTSNGSGSISTVKSYSTSNKDIATIDENTSVQTNCTDCKLVRIVCHKKGGVTLSAESSTGAKTTSKLTVESESVGTIAFDKESYSCNVGETFETLIRTSNSGGKSSTVKSYSTSDKSIATIDDKTSVQTNCIDCKLVRVVCHKKGSVTLNAESSTGAKATTKVIVSEEVGTISFEKDSYTCNAGETFETLITTKSTTGVPPLIKSYYTSDSTIATIDDQVTSQVRCINCRNVRVVCKKKGTVTLTAEASSGARTTSRLTVGEDIGTIAFDKTNYTCNAGETFETMIRTKGSGLPNSVASYSTSDNNIATIDEKTSVQTNCSDCRLVRVVCKKKGTVTLSASSTTGAKTTSSLTVKEDVGTISFEKSSYTCNAGETFETLITAKSTTGVSPSVKSYTTSDSTIATIDDQVTTQVKCSNCRNVRVVCKKKGTVTLSASSTTGAKTTSSLTVKEDVGTISFEKSSFTCYAGETFETIITAESTTGIAPSVKSYTTSDSTIATIDDQVTSQVRCINCRNVRVVCKKKGTVTLSASSTTGAKTTSSLTVKEDVGTIYFSKSSYSCKAGETFETLITAERNGLPPSISSYSVSDTSLATIDTKTSVQVNCYNCLMVRVVCKKKGNAKLNAASSSGAKTTIPLTITN